jgi:hypothetical protein
MHKYNRYFSNDNSVNLSYFFNAKIFYVALTPKPSQK